MNEQERRTNKTHINNMFIHIKSNIVLKNGQNYLDYLFNNNDGIIEYRNINFQQLECFSNRYCAIIKYKEEDYTKEDIDKLKVTANKFLSKKLKKDLVVTVKKDEEDYLNIIPIENGNNEYVCLIVPIEKRLDNSKTKVKLKRNI